MLAMSTLADAANVVVRTFLAPVCVCCHTALSAPLRSPVCGDCWQAIPRLTPPLCECCGDAVSSASSGPLCRRCHAAPPGYSVARSVGRYDGRLRDIIHAFKYGNRPLLAHDLAAMLLDAGASVLSGADAVVPVPLHPLRALHRGFNQADELSSRLRLPVWRVLRRVGYGPAQARLPASGRRENVRQAFRRKGLSWPRPLRDRWATRLAGRTVVLIDDVMTTGATLEACSAVLLEAGVRTVRALTVARALAGPPASLPPPLRPSAVPR